MLTIKKIPSDYTRYNPPIVSVSN